MSLIDTLKYGCFYTVVYELKQQWFHIKICFLFTEITTTVLLFRFHHSPRGPTSHRSGYLPLLSSSIFWIFSENITYFPDLANELIKSPFQNVPIQVCRNGMIVQLPLAGLETVLLLIFHITRHAQLEKHNLFTRQT